MRVYFMGDEYSGFCEKQKATTFPLALSPKAHQVPLGTPHIIAPGFNPMTDPRAKLKIGELVNGCTSRIADIGTFCYPAECIILISKCGGKNLSITLRTSFCSN